MLLGLPPALAEHLLATAARSLLAAPGCATEDGSLCKTVYDVTGNDFLARNARGAVVVPLTILLIVLVALVLRLIVHRAISRFVASSVAGTRLPQRFRDSRAGSLIEGDRMQAERRGQRTETVGSVLRSTSTIVIFTVAVIQILGQLGVNLAPIVASAGIVGVAVGFGAQNLVRDFLSGLFMILEDQYGVGDVIDAGPATGVVEAVGLRITRLRDVEGVVWHIRNGEIVRVGNKSQGWTRALLDIDVAYDTDLELATTVIARTGEPGACTLALSSRSDTSARTVRAMMPVGMTDIVSAGSTMYFRCSQSQAQTSPLPMPVAGSQFKIAANTITMTMPSQ